MEFKCQRLALSQIDIANTVHRISARDVGPTLVKSIEAQGMINPPIVRPDGKRYIILTGFSRIRACRQIGLHKITCLVVNSDIGPQQCARIAVTDIALHRDLSLIEQANAIDLLAQVQSDEAHVVQMAGECGMSVNRDMVRKLLKVSQMPLLLRQALSDGFIALPIALHLDAMADDAQRDALAKLLVELRVGLNRQREIIDWVVAISLRDGATVAAVLESEELARLRMDPEMDGRHKGQAIRQCIKKMRYPAISHHEARYARTVQSLNLAKGTHLTAPAHFEGQVYSLKLDFKSYDDLVKKQDELTQLIKSRNIKDLWKDDAV